MGGPARPLHEPGNHRSSERCSHRHSADCGSLIERPTLLRITAPTPRPGARSEEAARQVIAAYFDAIEKALGLAPGKLWTDEQGKAFAGYAPVLAAVGSLLALIDNYITVANRLQKFGGHEA